MIYAEASFVTLNSRHSGTFVMLHMLQAQQHPPNNKRLNYICVGWSLLVKSYIYEEWIVVHEDIILRDQPHPTEAESDLGDLARTKEIMIDVVLKATMVGVYFDSLLCTFFLWKRFKSFRPMSRLMQQESIPG